MSRSIDPGHFFQTDASEAKRALKTAKSGNKNGNPIALKSKILNAIQDPFSTSIYIAESAGCVRKVDLETRDIKTVYRGPAAPVTSVAIGGHGGNTIFAGCWDKEIWSWDRDSKIVGRRYKGHSDFIKAIVCAKIGGKDCLISGGADSKIIVWDTSNGERLHTLHDKTDVMMALQDLAIDPQDSNDEEVVLVSSSSDPHIRRWRINPTSASQIPAAAEASPSQSTNVRDTILEHETSVYKVLFCGDDEDMDLWTASADGTAKCLSRERNWATEETYSHGDFVRAVVVTSDWVVTAGRDENVKVWDKSTGKLWHIYEGHYEEITALLILGQGNRVASFSLDGTVRTWGLEKADIDKARAEKEDQLKGVVTEEQVQPKKSLLTEEEEAELADLMDSEDD